MAEVNIRKTNFSRLTSLLQLIDNHPTTPLDYAAVFAISERAKQAMRKCEQAHDVLVGQCKDDAALAIQESAFSPIEATYIDLETKAKRLLLSLPQPSSGSSGSTPSKSPVTVKLPEIKPPTFDGNFSNWLSFKDLFIAAVDKNTTLAASQKLQYLKSSLQGEPEKLVKSLTTIDSNYSEAWKILNERYDNEREIVHSLVNKIFSMSELRTESAIQLQALVDNTNECVRALKVLKRPTDSWDDMLVVLTVNKLDPSTRREWAIRQTGSKLPTFEELLNFLNSHIRGLNASGFINSSAAKQKDKNVRVHQVTAEQAMCVICNGNHPHYKCSEFLSKTPMQRSELTKRLHLCYNCIGKNHHIKDCPVKSSCKRCGKRHHTLLHVDQPQQQQSTTAVGRTQAASSSVSTHHVSAETRGLCKTAVVYVRDRLGVPLPCRVMIDDGSQGEFISEECAARLALKRQTSSIRVTGFGGVQVGTVKGKITTTLHSAFNSNKLEVELHVMQKLTRTLPSVKCKVEQWSHLHGLQLADPNWHVPGGIDILIGARHVPNVMLRGRRDGPPDTPTAFETIFGWVLCGVSAEAKEVHLVTLHVETDPLHNLVKRFWETEQFPVQPMLTQEEAAVEEHFKSTYNRDPITGRFSVSIPFNEKKQQLGASRDSAVKRFLQVEKRLQRQRHYKEQYIAFMREYEQLGHMTKLSENTCEKIGMTNYLPHHFVVNEDSSTTKLRVVFDGSAATTTGISLNDTMMVGATIQDDLYDHLLRFRLNPIVLKADIAKMFRQFQLKKPDAEYHRIVWREDPNKPLQDFRLETVTYGTACATFLSTRCLQQLAFDCADKYPRASSALLQSMYVDDLLATSSSPEEAVSLYRELEQAVGEAGLQLRKWSSNHPSVLEKIPQEQRESTPHSFNGGEPVKALGIRWHPGGDYFEFKEFEQSNLPTTKRTILSELCRIFDPLGLVSCIILRAKLLLQELWKCGVGWDDSVPEHVNEKWKSYKEDMKSIHKITIPRQVLQSKCLCYQLHSFSDASELAWGCNIYIRCVMADGSVTVNLVTSKTHVAPVKQITLPRLELNAAVSAAKLASRVYSTLQLDCQKFFWCDSTITLRWISASPRRWKTYVGNRVAIVQQLTSVEEWRHVPGVENPADMASRGAGIEDLKETSSWWRGPDWLSLVDLPVFTVPALDDKDGIMEERSPPVLVNAVEIDTSIVERFSSLIRLQRVTAYMVRFIQLTGGLVGNEIKNKPLSASELDNTLLIWIRQSQQQSFEVEISQLGSKTQIGHRSKLKALHPFLDSTGVLRVSGTLQNAQLPIERKHQVILSATSYLTQLIIRHFHVSMLHGGFQVTWNAIQEQYWIVGGRNRTRHFVRSCVICRRHRSKVAEQLMGNLPEQRVTPSRPFLHTGVDYAGPFLLKNPIGVAPKKYKGYLCVFVCMSTKALHLEAVSSLTTEAFLEALWRFTSRRGVCAHIYSDCGTNFVGAEKELRSHFQSADVNNTIAAQLANRNITWHFNVPSAPHHGGLWEAAVKSTKFHLRRVIGNNLLTYESFCTILCRIEAVLNSRPLYAMSSNPTDLSVLTPGHFLIGEPLVAIPEKNLEEVAQNRLSKFQLQQQRVQQFWRRWSKEYLNTLQQRNKWRWEKDDVKAGDLVLLVEETPPAEWKMGRILEVNKGSDGHVRSVTLKTASTVLQRPIVKLVPLIHSE